MQGKNLITIWLIMAAIMASLFFGTRRISLQSFAALGQEDMRRNVERARNAIDSEIQELSTTAGDYAAWDDAYRFIKDHNQNFVKSSLGEAFYGKLRLNLFLYCDDSGAIIHGKAFDYQHNQERPLPQSIHAQLKPDTPLFKHSSPGSVVSGLLDLPEGLMIIVSRPVLTSEYKGPLAGVLIIGRYLDAIGVKDLSKETHLPMQVVVTDEVNHNPGMQKIRQHLQGSDLSHVQEVDEEHLVGSTLLKDIYGHDAGLLQVTLPPHIYQQGKKAFAQFLVLYGATTAIFIVIFSLLGWKLALALRRDKEREEELARSEQRYRTVSHLSSDFAYSCIQTEADTFRVDWITDAFFSISGFSREELADQGCWLFCTHPEDSALALGQLQNSAIGTSSSAEFRIRTKNGSVRWLHNVMELQTDEQAPYGVRLIGAAREITVSKEAEGQVLRSLREKEVLLKEIHHRVKNNMQVIYSLLNLQATGITDKTVRAMFEESKNRVNTMSLIHERLYRSPDLAFIDFKEYLQSLVAGIADSYNRPEIVCVIDMEPLALDVNTGIPCGLIVNELVSNSLKHAFPNGKPGTITVGINKDRQGNNALVVADNGIGFPAKADFRNSKSLGMQLIMVLTGQLNGTVEILQREEGSSFQITFPGSPKERSEQNG